MGKKLIILKESQIKRIIDSVIKEQIKPKDPVPSKNQVAPSYKLPGITKDNISKFIEVNEEFLSSLGLIWDVYETPRYKELSRKAQGTRQQPGPCRRNPDTGGYNNWRECQPLEKEMKEYTTGMKWRKQSMGDFMRGLLTTSAKEGWTPTVLEGLSGDDVKRSLSLVSIKIPSVQSDYDNSWYNGGIKNSNEMYDTFEDELKPALKKAIEIKMQQLGISQQPTQQSKI